MIMKRKYDIQWQLKRFRAVESIGDKYFGDMIDDIKDLVDMDSISGREDIINPILDALVDTIKIVDIKNTVDTLDSSDVLLLYKTIIAKPHVLLANGISNYILGNREAIGMYYGDNLDSGTEDNIAKLTKSIKIDKDIVIALYFMERIVNDILVIEPKYNELDMRINSPMFKRLMKIAISTETNCYYSEILAENLLFVHGAIELICEIVSQNIREVIDPDNLIEDDIIGYLL